MICNATYDSLDAIPEALRDEFHQVDGKWKLKDSAIPGVGPLFNAALYANEQKAVRQAQDRQTKIKALEEDVNRLNDRLAVIDSPGSKSLSKDDADLWEQYNKLGTPKEISTKLTNLTDLQSKVEKFEISEGLAKITSTLQVNPEVLNDWATSSEGKGLTFFVKEVESTDAKGVKTMVATPYVRIETPDDKGKTHVQEKELLGHAKEVLPAWKYDALVTVADANGKGKPTSPGAPAPAPAKPGVRLPDLNSSAQPPASDEKKRPVDSFNERRAAKANPFQNGLVVGALATPGIKKA